MGAVVERWWPRAAGFASAVAYAIVSGSLPAKHLEILSAAVGAASVIVGFLAAAQSILASLPTDTGVIRWLKQANKLDRLFTYFADAIKWSLATVVVSMVALFWVGAIDRESTASKVASVVYVGLGVTAAASSVRAFRLFTAVIVSR